MVAMGCKQSPPVDQSLCIPELSCLLVGLQAQTGSRWLVRGHRFESDDKQAIVFKIVKPGTFCAWDG